MGAGCSAPLEAVDVMVGFASGGALSALSAGNPLSRCKLHLKVEHADSNKFFSIMSVRLTLASGKRWHQGRSEAPTQHTTLRRLSWLLSLCQGIWRCNVPRCRAPCMCGEVKQPFHARLHCVHLRCLQQLHGASHEGGRLPRDACLKGVRYQHSGCLLLIRLRTGRIQLEALLSLQGAEGCGLNV